MHPEAANVLEVLMFGMSAPNSPVDAALAKAGLRPRHGESDLYPRVLRIGPKEAEALLALNTDNRPVRKSRVDYYARTMREGGWKTTHQGIAFSVSGRGLDLQHRLHAVIKSGVEIEIMVVEGLADEAFEAIDQHERRSAADALRLHRKLVEEAKMIFSIIRPKQLACTNHEIREMCDRIEEPAEQLRYSAPASVRVFSSAGVRTAAIIMMMLNKHEWDRIIGIYRAFVLSDIESFTPLMASTFRQVSGLPRLGGWQLRTEIFTRMLQVFDHANANRKQIRITDAAIARARAMTILAVGGEDFLPSE